MGHEIAFMQLPAAQDNAPLRRVEGGLPPGWEKKEFGQCLTKELAQEQEDAFNQAAYQHAWTAASVGGDVVESLRVRYQGESRRNEAGYRLLTRMSGLSRRAVTRFQRGADAGIRARIKAYYLSTLRASGRKRNTAWVSDRCSLDFCSVPIAFAGYRPDLKHWLSSDQELSKSVWHEICRACHAQSEDWARFFEFRSSLVRKERDRPTILVTEYD